MTSNPLKQRPCGFGRKLQSIDQYLDNVFSQSNSYDLDFISEHRTKWFDSLLNSHYAYSVEDLLTCEHKDLEVTHHSNTVRVIPTSHKIKVLLTAVNGFWQIGVTEMAEIGIKEFTIRVDVGGHYRYHPDIIEKDITSKHGYPTYACWRSMVLDDIGSLEKLVSVVRERLPVVLPSITCSDRSSRLCRKARIPVRNNVAFLFPDSYS
jgi:hypothetical protein